MRKSLFASLLGCLMAVGAQAQNLVTNPGFEADASTFTVAEGTTNVLRRTANSFFDVVTQTTQPTSAAVPITAGMWVRKSSSTGFVKGVLTTTVSNSGAACLNLFIKSGLTPSGFTSVASARCVSFQKIATPLSNTKKYTASVWAKADGTANNQCEALNFYIIDGIAKTVKATTVPLTGGTTWTEYKTTLDIPAWITTHDTADFSTAYFGVGIITKSNPADETKTLYSGILLDDISLVEDDFNALKTNTFNSQITVDKGRVTITGLEESQSVSVYSITGKKVATARAINNAVSVSLSKGIYIVNTNNTTAKVVIN